MYLQQHSNSQLHSSHVSPQQDACLEHDIKVFRFKNLDLTLIHVSCMSGSELKKCHHGNRNYPIKNSF